MKVIIALACLLAFATALSLDHEDGLVKFEFDGQKDSPIGVVMKGQIDPKNELNNKIETFLKLASYYIPILESEKNESNNLKWAKTWDISLGGFGDITFSGSFNLVVGWRVFVNGNSLNMTADYLDVTYAPFAWGWADGLLQGTTTPAQGFYNATVYYSRASVPINLEIHSSGQVCYSGSAQFWPVSLNTNLSAELKGCNAEIISDLYNGFPISFACNYSTPFNLTHLNVSFTQNYTAAIVERKCINV
jgi:hypothetical protein